MDEYSFISENGNIRQIRDLIAKEKDEQQDTAINEVTTKVNRLVNYATSEAGIGTWIDGRTIYRRFIFFNGETSISDNGTTFTLSQLGLSDVDNIFMVYGFNTTGSKNERRRFSPMGVYWQNETRIQIRNATTITSYFQGIIIEYTKTTG